MQFLKRYRWSTLAALVGLFLIGLAVAFALESEQSGAQRVIGALIAGIPAVALFGGMWALRTQSASPSVANAAVGVGLVAVSIWWWMVIPVVAAALVLWFGVIKGELAHELAVDVASGSPSPV